MNFFKRINKTDWYIVLGFWIMASPIILMDYASHMSHTKAVLLLLVDIPLITLVSLVTVFVLAPKYLTNQKYVRFFVGLLGLLLLEAFLYWIGTSLIWMRWLIPDSLWFWLGDEIVSDGQSLGVLGGILLAKKYYESERDILKLESQTKSNELRALQSQVNPHFLFNNLNTLDELIDSNPKEAKKYVNKLAQLYRYLLNSKDEDVVTVKEELEFMENYIYLIRLRYGESYRFEIINTLPKNSTFLIPPATLQLVLENVVKHNIGSPTNALNTSIEISESQILISNDKRPKEGVKMNQGTGVKNLINRYKLLSDQEILIQNTSEIYEITIPLINLLNA